MASKGDSSDATSTHINNTPDLVSDNQPSQRQTKKQDDDNDWKSGFKAMKRDMLNRQFKDASNKKDKNLLEKSIKDNYDRDKGVPADKVEEAGKLLDILRKKEELKEATKKKDIKEVTDILEYIKDTDMKLKKHADDTGRKWNPKDGYRDHLLFEIAEANKLLRVVESGRGKKRHSMPTILKMDRNTMSEIKRYKTPPGGLHQTMVATFLLLGIDEQITEEWGSCAQLSNPDGREGLTRRIQMLDVSKIEPEVCARAKEILDNLEYRKILKASAGGATFYTWAMGTIDQYEESTNLEGVTPANIERQMELLRPESQRNKDDQPMFMPKINKPRAKATLNKDEQFKRSLRAPHSGGRAADILVEPKQYTKSDY